MGNKESLGRGAVQYLSAGRGITHSEMNDGAETCRYEWMHQSHESSIKSFDLSQVSSDLDYASESWGRTPVW